MRLCDRFHCLPSQLLDEDVAPLMRLLTIERLGAQEHDGG